MLHALKFREIHGAALDATEVEPPTLEAYSKFFELDSVIMTPHIGASTAANQSKSGVEAVETVFAILEGTGEPGRIDSISGTPSFVHFPAQANTHYDRSQGCCFEDGFCCENRLRSGITSSRVVSIVVDCDYDYDNDRV